MRAAAADLEFEEAARLRDEIKRLEALDLGLAPPPRASASLRRRTTGRRRRADRAAAATTRQTRGGAVACGAAGLEAGRSPRRSRAPPWSPAATQRIGLTMARTLASAGFAVAVQCHRPST